MPYVGRPPCIVYFLRRACKCCESEENLLVALLRTALYLLARVDMIEHEPDAVALFSEILYRSIDYHYSDYTAQPIVEVLPKAINAISRLISKQQNHTQAQACCNLVENTSQYIYAIHRKGATLDR